MLKTKKMGLWPTSELEREDLLMLHNFYQAMRRARKIFEEPSDMLVRMNIMDRVKVGIWLTSLPTSRYREKIRKEIEDGKFNATLGK